MLRVLSALLITAVLCASSEASLITISELNADTNDQLEGTLGGSGVDGGSTFSITTTPVTAQVASTTAEYLVGGVDLDGDGFFGEDFTFSVTFASRGDVNFSDSREVFGTGPSASISINDSFSLSVTVLSDSSATHDVSFDGVTGIDFQSLEDAGFDVTDASGTENFIAVIENNVFSRPFLNPLFEYVGGNGGRFGTVEEWSVQFSTSAIPEPGSLAIFGLIATGLGLRRRK